MSKILAVFGATGQQGSSVVRNVLDDPQLSQQFKIRAITRDVSSAKAQELKKDVEVVAGDITDRASLEKALAGVHTVYIVTTPSFVGGGLEIERDNAKRAADVAVEQGVKYIIFSTLPAVKKLSGGKYAKGWHFDAKAEAEEYMRTLSVPSAFISLGGYMENYTTLPFFMPQKSSDDTWTLTMPVPPATKLPLVAAIDDTGKFVNAILAEPNKYAGKTFAASVASYTMQEVVDALSKSSGKKIVYKEAAWEQFVVHLPPVLDESFPAVMRSTEEFGYYGQDTDGQVAWAAANARGKLHTLQTFLEAHPLKLQ